MKRLKIAMMAVFTAFLLILGSSLGYANPKSREIAPPAGATKGQTLQVDDEDSFICKTMDDCNRLDVRVQARIAKLQSASLTWGDIVKKDPDSAPYCPGAKEGAVCMMNWHNADQYCKDQHKRLPTVREQAQWSQAHGAKGIQETDPKFKDLSINDDKVDAEIEAKKTAGYYTIYKKNNARQVVVDFYFNKSDYKRPTGDEGKYSTWSSSADTYNDENAYSLSGDKGMLRINRGYGISAVRCVVGR